MIFSPESADDVLALLVDAVRRSPASMTALLRDRTFLTTINGFDETEPIDGLDLPRSVIDPKEMW